jgi:hypothetical protein
MYYNADPSDIVVVSKSYYTHATKAAFLDFLSSNDSELPVEFKKASAFDIVYTCILAMMD